MKFGWGALLISLLSVQNGRTPLMEFAREKPYFVPLMAAEVPLQVPIAGKARLLLSLTLRAC